MNKKLRIFLIYLELNWKKILLILLVLFIGTTLFSLIYFGLRNVFSMEAFSRRQLFAMMGIYLIVGLLQAFVFVGLYMYFLKGFYTGSFLSRLGNEKIEKNKPNIKWTDVIGMEHAKSEAWELVRLLKDLDLVQKIGGKIVKGTLMIGPPGCGKTYLAKAIATECDMPMISTVGSEFVGIFVGQGAAQMKSLFKQARVQARLYGGCIIFIDEMDSFARPRMADTGFGGGISHNATINQFLTELDGLRRAENNIVVIGATNFQEHELDPAIMRAGRFDRKIHITRPNLKERKELFDFYLSKVKVDTDVNPEVLARKTLWYTPSDVDAMVREAGIIALRDKRDAVNMKDLSEAYDRITYGSKSNITMNEEDKRWTAYHESGHAIITYLLHPKDDVIKATIIPRKGFLGFVSHQPREEHYSHNREYFLAQIKISIASYAAEELIYGSTSSGVGGSPGADFYTALNTARSMVWSYGMGPSGYIGDYRSMWRYAQEDIPPNIKDTLEKDVQSILQECLKEVRGILTKHRDLLEHFAQELFKKEELEYDEIETIFKQFGVQPVSRTKT
jgi:cell division protease FtsH